MVGLIETQLTLSAIAGPSPVRVTLAPDSTVTIGRLPSNTIQLDHPEVSRHHLQLFCADGQWFLRDVGSRHGTRVNGMVVPRDDRFPLNVDDLIEVSPWTFRLMDEFADVTIIERVSLPPDRLPAGSTVTPIGAQAAQDLDRQRLRLLLSFADRIQAADDEKTLADALLEAIVAGTGYPNAAMLRPTGDDGTIQIVAKRGRMVADDGRPLLSRSLIREASRGRPAQLLTQDVDLREARSIVQLGIQQAICVPLMLESTLAGYLYLDRREAEGSVPLRTGDAGAFAAGVAHLASMAMSNLLRRELRQRLARMEYELKAAASAQQLVLPPRQGRIGTIEYIGESRPGQLLSGDFFDVIELDDHRLAVSFGDVAGKGIVASVLMTTAQGYLHSALRQHRDPLRAVSELNEYVLTRGTPGKFITLWVGLFDVANSQLQYVNAGHGYAWHVDASGKPTALDHQGGLPIGVEHIDSYDAATVPWNPGDRVVIVSDGIIEQPARASMDEEREEFGRERLERWLPELGQPDAIERLLSEVQGHAGSAQLADDATVLIVSRHP